MADGLVPVVWQIEFLGDGNAVVRFTDRTETLMPADDVTGLLNKDGFYLIRLSPKCARFAARESAGDTCLCQVAGAVIAGQRRSPLAVRAARREHIA